MSSGKKAAELINRALPRWCSGVRTWMFFFYLSYFIFVLSSSVRLLEHSNYGTGGTIPASRHDAMDR